MILDILSRKPRLAAKDLYGFFLQKYKPGMTLQGFYRVIRSLVERRVLVKEEKLLSIDAAWIFSLQHFLGTLQKTYFGQQSAAVNILLDEGETREFIFESPMEMDNFWTHALIMVTEYYGGKGHEDLNGYAYTHHCWFQVAKTGQEQQLIDAYKEHGMRLYHVGGSTVFLDSLVTQFIHDPSAQFVLTDGQPFGENYYAMSIGDFLFETRLPEFIFDQMEDLYEHVKSISQFNAEELLNIVRQHGRTRFTVTRNKKRVAQFRSKMRATMRLDV